MGETLEGGEKQTRHTKNMLLWLSKEFFGWFRCQSHGSEN